MKDNNKKSFFTILHRSIKPEQVKGETLAKKNRDCDSSCTE